VRIGPLGATSLGSESRAVNSALLCLSFSSFITVHYVIDLAFCVYSPNACEQDSLVAAGSEQSLIAAPYAPHRHLRADTPTSPVLVRTQHPRPPKYESTDFEYSHIPLASSGMNHPPPHV